MLMVKNFGLEAEGGGEKISLWRDMEGEKIFELLRGGIWRGRKQFLDSLEGGYGG